ncbi:uncharacterized protein PHALS_04487 [Plasmopara halstedii]|uniref:RxLR-like protein n=1 Tax=Plasmopara halstedii TaxID=4781 RepID=A0A0P1A9L3_PLAHL|nr:uncharacterized protein PHALS_04487 [Plasmopara halstedii]CEG37022.1 hypothetical protein PHALS_04487 [Plasmopara halstedii]|eukprot:XP_024573391.1 hypothetical protein PHALS_04487 [Plasmopara halstedii]
MMVLASFRLNIAMLFFLFAEISAWRSVIIPEDNPQACNWDIRMCVDGTWVYRAADRHCDFEECVIKAPLDKRLRSDETSTN